MIIGVDFDNTLACYDHLFHQLAMEQGLISLSTPANKTAVRDTLRAQGKEQQWINLQGLAYGRRINEATIFPGALDFFRAAHHAQITLYIVSHKTRFPVSGDAVNLHEAATGWLSDHGFFDDTAIALPRSHVFFELTKQDKLARIKTIQCDHFIDDLPEFLNEPSFPARTNKWLFDPTTSGDVTTMEDAHSPSRCTARSWHVLTEALIRSRTAV